MQTATYIDESTRETIRARSISYLQADVAPGLTLHEHRHALRTRGPASGFPRRVMRAIAGAPARYPDDPAGDYETTDGGW